MLSTSPVRRMSFFFLIGDWAKETNIEVSPQSYATTGWRHNPTGQRPGRWGWYPIKSQGIANRTKMAPTGALKQHSDNTFLAPLTCFSSGKLLCLGRGNSGPRNKRKEPFPRRKDRKERAETYSCPLTVWFQVARKSKWWGTLKRSLHSNTPATVFTHTLRDSLQRM